MTPLEEGKKFSEEVYASKDEVQAYYNVENIGSYWNHIISYRSFFDYQTSLKNIDGNNFKVCLTNSLISKAYKLQLDLVNDLLDFIALPVEKQNKILLDRKNKSLQAVCRFNHIKEPTQDILDRISLNKMESIPTSLFVLDAYSKTYNENYFLNGLSIDDFEKISKGCASQLENDEVAYRKNKYSDLNNPLNISDCLNIKALLLNLSEYLGDNNIPLILRALTIPFAYSYIIPFEYFYEECAALTAKNYSFSFGLKTIGFLLDFESIAFSKTVFKYMKKTQENLDLTYYLTKVLPYIIEDEKNIHSLIQKTKSEKDLKEDSISNDEDIETALPVFPIARNKDNIEDTAKKLREIYPQLKKKEAHFYASHCTIGLRYTIEQFKEEEHTVYETARTSMESLAKKGFYKKEQYKNKFVYTPIPQKEKI